MLSLSKNNRYRIAVEKWTIDIASLWKLTIAEVYNGGSECGDATKYKTDIQKNLTLENEILQVHSNRIAEEDIALNQMDT